MTAAVRLHFATSVFGSLFVNNSAVGGLVLITFALLSGINLAVLAFVVSGSFRQAVSGGAANLGAIVSASVGAGCAACGTSFLAPLIGGIAGTASITLTRELGVLANVIGISLLAYSIYRLGIAAAGLLPVSRKL